MKVYLGYHCKHDFAEVWRNVERVFDDEVKALLWAEDADFAANAERWTDGEILEWREYEEREVE